jgi:hypothetical protein
MRSLIAAAGAATTVPRQPTGSPEPVVLTSPLRERRKGLLVDVYVNANYGAVHNF